MQRGKIRNRERAKQLRDFTGLLFKNITPTDIDAFVEFGDVLFVFIEAKQNGYSLPYGQKLGLERICDAIHRTENEKGRQRLAVLLVIEHETQCDEDIDCAEAPVVGIYQDARWETPQHKVNCREAIESLLIQVGLGRHYIGVKRWQELQQAKKLASE